MKKRGEGGKHSKTNLRHYLGILLWRTEENHENQIGLFCDATLNQHKHTIRNLRIIGASAAVESCTCVIQSRDPGTSAKCSVILRCYVRDVEATDQNGE